MAGTRPVCVLLTSGWLAGRSRCDCGHSVLADSNHYYINQSNPFILPVVLSNPLAISHSRERCAAAAAAANTVASAVFLACVGELVRCFTPDSAVSQDCCFRTCQNQLQLPVSNTASCALPSARKLAGKLLVCAAERSQPVTHRLRLAASSSLSPTASSHMCRLGCGSPVRLT